MGLCHSEEPKILNYYYKQDNTDYPVTFIVGQYFITKNNQPLNGKYTLYQNSLNVVDEKKELEEKAIIAVFNNGKTPYATIFKHNKIWYKGDVDKKLRPCGEGVLYHENSNIKKFTGSLFKNDPWHGTMYDKEGKMCMKGEMCNEGRWCLDGILKIYTSSHIYDAYTNRCGHLGSAYDQKKDDIRYQNGIYEKGKFSTNKLIEGERITFLPYNKEEVCTIRYGNVIDIQIRNKQTQLPQQSPMELLGFVP